MGTDRNTRKLRAILSADVKGYSLLMAADESHTIQTLKAYRQIMDELIQKHSGRVVDNPGDNLLAEFSSAVNAVNCAVEIQNRLKKENSKFVEGKQLQFRIGVNIGDVVHDDGRIYGSGINVAARIEGIADPGGICISRNTYDQVKDKLDLEFEYIGEHEVKNVAEPVRVYRVQMDTEPLKPLVEEQLKLPDKPSIAVLPFTNMSGDPSQEYFSDGLTEQIINGLCKVSNLFVIARNSSFAYKGKAVSVKQIAKELGVRYILEGSVQRAASRVRITAQLIDATTDYHMWSENYDRDLEDIFELQDEITMKLIGAIDIKLSLGEQARHWAECMPKNIKAYDALMRGNECRHRQNRKDNIQSRIYYNESIGIEPTAAMPHIMKGFSHVADMIYRWSESPLLSFEKAEKCAETGYNLFHELDLATSLMSWILFFKRDFDRAINEGRKAVNLNPNGASAHSVLATVLTYSGETQEAVDSINTAIRLDPYPPILYFHILGFAYRNNGQYGESIEICKYCLEKNPSLLNPYITLASSYALFNRIDKAQSIAKELLLIEPGFTVSLWEATMQFKYKSEQKKIAEALRKAGLPD